MGRSHYWQYILNSEGQPIEGAIVRLYPDGSETPVNLYTAISGETSASYRTTDNNGFFEFWVGDRNELENSMDGYATNATYTLSVSGVSLTPRTITGIQFLFQPPRMYEESLTTSVSAQGGGVYSKRIIHNLGTLYPLVQAWNMNTTTSMTVSCQGIDTNTTEVSAVSGTGTPQLAALPVHLIFMGADKV